MNRSQPQTLSLLRICLALFLVWAISSCHRADEHLFRSLDASQTGISFSNDLQSSDTLNAFVFTNFYNGGGVGIADFNQDGIPDICFTANQQAPELYLGKGGLQFDLVPGSGLTNPGWVSGISIVDINQDGWPDIYLSMAAHSAIRQSANQLYINQRTTTPSFKEEAAQYGLAYVGFSMQTVFFDYDQDGDLDAFMLNTAPDVANPNVLRPAQNDGTHPSADKLFRNTGRQANGSYRYEDVSVETGIVFEGLGLGVALADFNQDGWTDIYCSNDFQSDDALYLNQGDGTFRNVIKQAVRHTSLYGMGIDAADFNNDLATDIFQLDMLPEDNERQKQMIARGDYEKKQLSISPRYHYNLQYMRNMLQVNQGQSGSLPLFSEQGFLYDVAATDWSWSILLADYDLDGWKDAFITNGYRKNVTDLDFIAYNKNNNLFGQSRVQEAKREEFLKEIPEIKLRNYAFKNIPGEGFHNVAAQWGLDAASYSNGAAYADLDGDGDLDLVVNNIDEAAFVYENRSQSKQAVTISLQGAEGNREGIGAQVIACTGDNCQVFAYFPVRGYLSSMNTPVVIGLGTAEQLDRLEVHWPGGKREVLQDIKAGSQVVLKATAAAPHQPARTTALTIFKPSEKVIDYVHRESDYVDFRQVPTLQKMLTHSGPAIAHGDFNGDGRSDVVIGGAYRGSPTVVYYEQSDGAYLAGDTLPTDQLEVGALAVLDVNEDGMADILVAPGASERPMSVREAFQPLLFLGSNEGVIPFGSLPELNICTESVLAQDLNGDGKTDLLLGGSFVPEAYPNTCPSVLLLRQGDGFVSADASWLDVGFAIKDMTAADLDQDGDEDILLTGHWGGVVLLRNNGQSYSRENLDLPTGWWNSIKAADIDSDGDLDLVLGNEGLNCIYRASPEQPVRLLAKDFNGDGRIDPIWGLFLQQSEVPVHPLGTLTDQIVQYKKRYNRFREYAKADLQDLFTSGDLEGVQELQATELRSGLAYNDGTGRFTFEALPLAAQQSPVNDILITDVDQDERPDLLLVGNFYPNEPIFGRSDASYGTLLLGKADGSFGTCPLNKSGLKLDGDARELLYLPQKKLLLVTQNEGSVQSYRLQ